MQRIIYQNSEGGVSIVIPAPDYTGTMTELAASTVPVGIDYAIVEHTDIPADRTFRNEWEVVDDVVCYLMTLSLRFLESNICLDDGGNLSEI